MATEKFKPIPHSDQDKRQRADVDMVDEYWAKHPWVLLYHGYWREWIAWLYGDQYKIYNKRSQMLHDVSPFVQRETKNVYNRILPTVRQAWGEINFDHSFKVDPNTTEPEDIKAAKIASHAIEFTNLLGGFRGKYSKAKWWSLVTGSVFWKEWWNKTKMGTALNPKTMKATAIKGDVDFDFVIPFNVRPDPYGDGPTKWRWVVEGQVVPTSAVEQEFGLPKGSIKPTSIEQLQNYAWISDDLRQVTESPCLRIEYWQKPSEEHPQGRFMVIADDWILWDKENPSPKKDRLPYFHLIGLVPRMGEMVGDSLVRIGQQGQRQFNRSASMIDEQHENFRPKGLIPFGTLRGGDMTAYRKAGVDFVEYNPRLGAPYWQNPPDIRESQMAWLKFQEAEIKAETSIRDVSMGQIPKYGTRASGVLFEGLKQQDTTVISPALEDQEDAIKDAMSYRLELIQEHYKEDRMLKVFGRNKIISIRAFSGAELRGNTDVRVSSGIDVFATKKNREEVVMMLVEKGAIQDFKEAMNILENKDIDDFLEDEFIDERQAFRELELLKTKDVKDIDESPDDNHEAKYIVFNNFRKSEEFSTLTPKAQDRILAKIEKIKEAIAPKATTATATPEPTAALSASLGPLPAAPAPAALSPEIAGPAPAGAPALPGGLTPDDVLAMLAASGGAPPVV